MLQVRKLLRTEGLIAGGRGGGVGRLGRRRKNDDEGFLSDGDGWASADGETGDVLFDVEKPELERLYQQYIVEEDYLEKVESVQWLAMSFCWYSSTCTVHTSSGIGQQAMMLEPCCLT